jgi:hypothetical protein
VSAAIEPAQHGKSTQDSGKLSVGDATRTLTLPHLPYGDAVLAKLDAARTPPAAVEAGLRSLRSPELFMRFVWPVGTALLDDGVRDKGLTLAWSHVTGWSAHDAYGAAELLDVDALADPRLIALAALDLVEQEVHRWRPPEGLTGGRWSEAVYLDIALGLFDEKSHATW